MVTARADTHDVVAGLEAGADDYLTKPFAPKELSARIRALLRRARTSEVSSPHLRFGDLEIVPDEGVVRRNGRDVHLTKTEFRVLVELAQSPGRVFSREVLLERIWGYGYFGDGRLVDVHVRRLRTKVEADPANPRHVVTVRGLGLQAPGLTGPSARAPVPAHPPARPPRPHHARVRGRRAAAVGAPVDHHARPHPREPARPAGGRRHRRRLRERRHRAAAGRQRRRRRRCSARCARRSGPGPSSTTAATSCRATRSSARTPCPPSCATRSSTAQPSRMRFELAATCSSPSASRSRRPDVAYFEIVSLDDLEDTLERARRVASSAPRSSPPSPAPASAGGPAAGPCGRSPGVSTAATALAAGRLDTRLESSDDPDLRPIADVVQRHGPGPAGPHRARRPVRLRREPRAAIAAHDAGGVDRGAGQPARRAARAVPGRARPDGRPTSTASSSSSRTCSRSPGSTPASCASSSRRSTWPSW